MVVQSAVGWSDRLGGAVEPQPRILLRLEEPLHVFEGSRSDVVRRRSICEVRLLQEVDTGSSAETTVNARLIQLSAHEKNRCVLFD
jgi:hypothetical protein